MLVDKLQQADSGIGIGFTADVLPVYIYGVPADA